MLVEIMELVDNQCFVDYIGEIKSGQFYEALQELFSKELGGEFVSRDEAKIAIFQVLFTANRFKFGEDAKFKRLFNKTFPSIAKLFELIKSKEKNTLPCLLQSIESYLIIDVIAKRISIECPNAPIYPIHDSITTTLGYADKVKQIMNEELTEAIGYKPTLHLEYWRKENMDKYLDKLKSRACLSKVA